MENISELDKKHPLDWNAKLVSLFLQNSRLVWLLIISIVIGGTFSLLGLRREGFPAVSPNIVLIQTLYPGASANEVESQITKNIEASIKDVKGLTDISATSANSFSNVTLTLSSSIKLDQAVQDIQSKVQSAQGDLPKDADKPKVATVATGGPAFIYGISTDGNKEETRQTAIKIANELDGVKGIKSAKLTNAQEERISIKYNLTELKSRGVDLTTLSTILQGSNVNFPVGKLDINNKNQSISSIGAYTNLEQIRGTVVGINPLSHVPTQLKDIAEVSSGPEPLQAFERFTYTTDNKLKTVDGSSITIVITDTADIISTRAKIEETVQKLKNDKTISESTTAIALYDQAQDTADQINEIVGAIIGSRANFWLLGGLQLLFLAILLFVNWRAALVAATAIPLSLGFTFICLYLLGIQLNTIVLFSLILVLSLVVDPAIVMVEAIQRYRDLQLKPDQAIIESGRRYGASLFMAVLTSLIVFIPFGVVSGIFGQIIKYIPLTVIPALFASYMVPIALLPILTRRSLKPLNVKHTGDETEGLSKAAEFVMQLNRWILAKTVRQIGLIFLSVILVSMSLALVIMGRVQLVQFSKPADVAFLSVTANFPKGLTFSDRDAVVKQIEGRLKEEKAVKQFSYFSQSTNSVMLFVNLKDKKERKAEEQSSKMVVAKLQSDLEKYSFLSDVKVSELSSGPPSSDYQIQTQIYSNDPAKLESAAKTIGDFLRETEHVTKVDDGFTNKGEPELQIVLDRAKVQQAGLSSFEIGSQLKAILDQSKVARFIDPVTDESSSIYLTNAEKPASIDEIKSLPLTSRSGVQLTVADLATVKEATAVDSIVSFNGSRYVEIKARLDDTKNTIATQQKLDSFLTKDKIKELGLDSVGNKGDFEDIANSFKDLGIALVVAILLTYIVLVLQFKSFSLPAIMLFTIPLSLIGVFPALWFTGSDLGFLELLGVTILVGIVENVAIFLIDYANQLVKERDFTAKEAIIQASGVRFRPILLTKLVALGGLLPLAIESDFWRGLSVVIIAGIGLSGFFSLLVIPTLYVWISGLRGWAHRVTNQG